MFGKREITWHLLFSSLEKAEELLPKNKAMEVEVDNKSLCIVRSDDGYFVTDNSCPHQKLPLSRGGFCENGHLVCPFHRYQWEMKTGRESRRNEANMKIYPVKINENGLFIGIEGRKRFFF